MEDRRTGWLVPIFYYKFRELLTHTAFRFGLCSPLFCCMPDHIHMLWIGIMDQCDQRKAMRYFRRQLNPVLEKLHARLQKQPYDHVLRDEEVAEYIARNPERKGLVKAEGFRDYPYTSCLVPGYPELKPFESGYGDRFWRVYCHLRQHGLHAPLDKDEDRE